MTDPSFTTPSTDTTAPELAVSRDMVRRGLIVAPLLILGGWVVWGADGAWSTGLGLLLVLVNFGLAAGLIAWAARISLSLMMAACLGGYVARLALITIVVLLVKDQSWVSIPALGTSIIVSHLGLLFWELRYVAASLAFPGLRPDKQYLRSPRRSDHPKD